MLPRSVEDLVLRGQLGVGEPLSFLVFLLQFVHLCEDKSEALLVKHCVYHLSVCACRHPGSMLSVWRSEDKLGRWSSPFTLFETESLCYLFGYQVLMSLCPLLRQKSWNSRPTLPFYLLIPLLVSLQLWQIPWQKELQGEKVHFSLQFSVTVHHCGEVKVAGTWSYVLYPQSKTESTCMLVCA